MRSIFSRRWGASALFAALLVASSDAQARNYTASVAVDTEDELRLLYEDGLLEADEFDTLKYRLEVAIWLVREAKQEVVPLEPTLRELFARLPHELAIERLIAELPAWTVTLELAESVAASARPVAALLLEDALVEHVAIVEREDAGPALRLELRPVTESFP